MAAGAPADAAAGMAAVRRRLAGRPVRGRAAHPDESARGQCRLRDRRRPRGRADLPADLRGRGLGEARRPPVDLVADARGHPQGLRRAAAVQRVRRSRRRRPGPQPRRLARRHEPDQVLQPGPRRGLFGRARADAHAGDAGGARARDPQLRARGLPRGGGGLRRGRGPDVPRDVFQAGEGQAPDAPARGRPGSGGNPGPCQPRQGRHPVDQESQQETAAASPVRPHRAPAARQPPLRPQCEPHAGDRAATVRAAQGNHLSPHRQPASVDRHCRRTAARREAGGGRVRRRRDRGRDGRPSARQALRQRREGHRPSRHRADRLGAGRRAGLARAQDPGLGQPPPAAGVARRPQVLLDDRNHAHRVQGGRGPVPLGRNRRGRGGLEGAGCEDSPAARRQGQAGARPAGRARGRPAREAAAGRSGREADAPAGAIHGGDAAHRHGVGRQDCRQQAALGRHEGARHRHARDAGVDHRDPAEARVRRARQEAAAGDGQGNPLGRVRPPESPQSRDDGRMGVPAARDRARERRVRLLHARHRGVRARGCRRERRGKLPACCAARGRASAAPDQARASDACEPRGVAEQGRRRPQRRSAAPATAERDGARLRGTRADRDATGSAAGRVAGTAP